MLRPMNTEKTIPKPHQLQESTAGEEDPGAGLDAADSAIHPNGVAPTAKDEQPRQHPEPGKPEKPDKRADERR